MTNDREVERRLQRLADSLDARGLTVDAREVQDAVNTLERLKDAGLTDDDVAYPRDVFSDLISRNSPYAFYLFQWVPYQTDAKRWRLKLCHDVRTFDGREANGIWPNGSHCGPFRDDDVEFIRISRSQHGYEWADPRPSSRAADQDAVEAPVQDQPKADGERTTAQETRT